MTISWFSDVRPPRTDGGAISEMYSGPTIEANPMAIPSIIRPATSTSTVGATAMRNEPRKNTPADRRMNRFRPMR